ncbi:MAG: DUF1295 domain-containing protein [Myxococcaceae bacterium]|nr:DUF1295 domain-containing protein [Myxococcaceae bacterium]
MLDLHASALAAIALLGCLTTLWLLSLALRDSSIVDIFWGPAFGLIAWVSVAAHGPAGPRALLAAGLTTLWGLRLGAYLFWRNHRRPEDPRYTAMRRRHGESWWWKSYLIVFVLQGALAWVVSLPVQAAVASAGPLGLLDAAAAAVVLFGVGFESLGDLQLARFKASPEGKGALMTRGLWSWTRHPNYFGDFTTWWGLGLLGVAAGAPWTLLGPAVMAFLLMRVSGVPLLEKAMRGRPGYDDYVARTSAFFPRPPRR